MKTEKCSRHSIVSLFTMVLFGVYVLFLLLLLLFSAKTYESAAAGLKEADGLRTSMVYLTTKVHQHDRKEQVYVSAVEGTPALCLLDFIDGKEYITYIYLDDTNLKELFTSHTTVPTKAMGTTLCSLLDFRLTQTDTDMLYIQLTDKNGKSGELYLHPGVPSEGGSS